MLLVGEGGRVLNYFELNASKRGVRLMVRHDESPFFLKRHVKAVLNILHNSKYWMMSLIGFFYKTNITVCRTYYFVYCIY